jgi:putative DNA primase/helicase
MDKHLEGKLALEAAGIFNWLYDGFRRWQTEGLTKPRVVVDATEEYKVENDSVSRWIDARCEYHPEGILAAATGYADYRLWMLAEGEKPQYLPNSTAWGHRMTEKGLTRKKDRRGNVEYRGLRIADYVVFPDGGQDGDED